jgi:hypothetical protein
MKEIEKLTSTRFGTQLGARFVKKRSGKGYVYVGVGLRSDRSQVAGNPTQMQGSVHGSESDVGSEDVSPQEEGVTREDPEKGYTTVHHTQSDSSGPAGWEEEL